jgi:hypothetical protein
MHIKLLVMIAIVGLSEAHAQIGPKAGRPDDMRQLVAEKLGQGMWPVLEKDRLQNMTVAIPPGLDPQKAEEVRELTRKLRTLCPTCANGIQVDGVADIPRPAGRGPLFPTGDSILITRQEYNELKEKARRYDASVKR